MEKKGEEEIKEEKNKGGRQMGKRWKRMGKEECVDVQMDEEERE